MVAQSVQQAAERLAKKRVILLDEPTRPPSVEDLWTRSWFALFVHPGCEQCVRRDLAEAGYSTFLPVHTYWNSSRFRVKRQLERPLLVRYLFAGVPGRHDVLPDADWNAWGQIEGITCILGDKGGRPIPVPIENVVQLAGEVEAGFYDDTGNTYDAGETLMISKGVFASFPSTTADAVARDAAPDDPIRVIVRLFGRETIMQIPLADLRPAR